MPPDDDRTPIETHDNAPSSASSRTFQKQTSRVRNLFTIPAPVKRLFDKVPVLTYPSNELPQRTPRPSKLPSLYVFIKDEDAASGRPSFNPGCLKWQVGDVDPFFARGKANILEAFLKIAEVEHRLLPSNNHASPTGVLPFLLPPSLGPQTPQEQLLPIPSNKLVKFALENGSQITEPPLMRSEVYQSLLDHRIRNAWLYYLYLDPTNFSSVAERLYVQPISTNILVRMAISHQLRAAAEAELLKHGSIIDVDDLYSEADKAFDALSILLGDAEWFFGGEMPTLFDASVFAYTQLLLDEKMGWKEKSLIRAIRKRENLVRHRERLLISYFEEDE